MKLFSVAWRASQKPSKQRKYRANAPLHMRKAFLKAPLAEDLSTRYKISSLPVREGDVVKIAKGELKGISGKINSVDRKKCIVYVDGAERVRKDGTKSRFPLRPSNLMLTELNLDDKRRAAILMKKSEGKPEGESHGG